MALEDIRPGLVGEVSKKVTRAMAVNRPKTPQGGVLSTPALVSLLENAGIKAAERYLPKGYLTVGFHVDVRHIAPTPVGMEIRAKAELTEINGNKLTFAVEAHDEEKKVAVGTHRRAIIQVPPANQSQ
ncbi:MAG: thioesterase family protein [Dehalococcoidia bacterium]